MNTLFHALGLKAEIMKAIEALGFEEPSLLSAQLGLGVGDFLDRVLEALPPPEVESPSEVAHACGALRIDAFMPLAGFRERVDQIIELMHLCPTAPGVERIFVPGEIEHETERRRTMEGIPINAELQQELRALGDELDQRPPF